MALQEPTGGKGAETCHRHPLHILMRASQRIFHELGFSVALGPEMESEYYNFDALNVPAGHPSRDMQDTFWIRGEKGCLLRTHTSAVQIRYMEKHKPPVKIISLGKVFRNEATDRTHEAQFFQIEGLWVGKDVSLALLKGVLRVYLTRLFEDESLSLRMRPSYFPFVEPGLEVDICCFACRGRGCHVCKETGWIEVLGAGMVHPRVLLKCGINPRKWQGFAFGGGVDRLAMVAFGIDDVRLFYTGDLRLVYQF